jgi:hypothetical protein
MNRTNVVWLLFGLGVVFALALVSLKSRQVAKSSLQLSTRVIDPGLIINSDGAPSDLRGFPKDAIAPLVQIIAARSWAELAPFYSDKARLSAERGGQSALIDSNRSKPFFYENTIISETQVSMEDGEKLLIVQVVPLAHSGSSDEARVWRPTTLVCQSGKWLVDLRFEGKQLNWFLMNTKPSRLPTMQEEFKSAIKASLSKD